MDTREPKTSLIPAGKPNASLIRVGDSRTSLIPATPTPRVPASVPPPRKRHMPAWLVQITMVAGALVIVGAVLLGVAHSTPVHVTSNTATYGGYSSYSTTYAAHCTAGKPFQVKPGETLASIAKRMGVSEADLAKTNGLTTKDTLIPGEVLCPAVPGASLPVFVGTTSLELCQSTDYWLPVITQWAVPPGCYGYVYKPNPADYPYRPGWGWCNWWPEEMHPNLPGDEALRLPRHRTPRVGATVWFDPGEQGASSDGHWAELVAINPDGYWLLISEMNNTWRGAGWGRVDYRYIHMSPGVWFLY